LKQSKSVSIRADEECGDSLTSRSDRLAGDRPLLIGNGRIRDNSLREEIWSDDAEYIVRRIREEYLTGTSCTVILCGKETPWRKFVDWEIKATLDKQHGIVGVGLPRNPPTNGKVRVPDRFFDNYQSGYGVWLSWEQLFPNQQPNVAALRAAIESANSKSKDLMNNTRTLMSRNGISPY